MTLKLQFDPNQPYQHDAVESVARLFEGLPRQGADFKLGDEIVPNLPPFESLSESWLYDNLRATQQDNNLATDLAGMLSVDDGMVLEGVGNESWRHPSFTIEKGICRLGQQSQKAGKQTKNDEGERRVLHALQVTCGNARDQHTAYPRKTDHHTRDLFTMRKDHSPRRTNANQSRAEPTRSPKPQP